MDQIHSATGHGMPCMIGLGMARRASPFPTVIAFTLAALPLAALPLGNLGRDGRLAMGSAIVAVSHPDAHAVNRVGQAQSRPFLEQPRRRDSVGIIAVQSHGYVLRPRDMVRPLDQDFRFGEVKVSMRQLHGKPLQLAMPGQNGFKVRKAGEVRIVKRQRL